MRCNGAEVGRAIAWASSRSGSPALRPSGTSASSHRSCTASPVRRIATTLPRVQRDVFLLHAGEDKPTFVAPFADALHGRCLTYWLDSAEIRWGDSLVGKVNEGLRDARYAVLFLSRQMLSRDKNWPRFEWQSALSVEVSTGIPFVLPLLCGVDYNDIRQEIPLLAGKRLENWDDGLDKLISALEARIGRRYKRTWVFPQDASVTGPIWVRVVPSVEFRGRKGRFLIRWGAWRRRGEFAGCDYLVFAKTEPDAVPLHVDASLLCHCEFGVGEPPNGVAVQDLNDEGWRPWWSAFYWRA